MLITAEAPEAREAVRLRHRRDIDDLDYRRALVVLSQTGASQREIARLLGISQAAVHGVLARAADLPRPAAGFSGATPMEICQRYAGGFLTRDQLVEELARWEYSPAASTDGLDSLLVDPPGAWSQVETAAQRGLIGEDVYEEVFHRRHHDWTQQAPAR